MRSAVLALTLAVTLGNSVPWSSLATPPDATAAERAASAEPTAAAVASRAGNVPRLSMEDAIRELDLIRPSRPKVADDFTLPTADGKTFQLSAFRGRPIFVNFWATWCPPCLEEMPAMERLWRAQRKTGLVMLAVAVDANPKLVPAFLERHGLTFAVGLDARMEVANAYGVRALPSSFVIDRDGRLTALAIGPRAWDNVAAHSLIERLSTR